MVRDRARQLGMAGLGQPRGRAVAVGERAQRMVARQDLVDVVEERGRLDEPAVDRRAAPVDAHGEPARHLGHGARVAHHPGLGIEGEQQRDGLQPPGHRHRLDGTRPPGDDRPAGRQPRRDGAPATSAGGRDGGAGRTPVTGTAHRNAGVGAEARTATADGPPRPSRDPSARTLIPPASKPTTTVPSRSVRRTRAPAAASRSSVALAGCPYGLPAPAEATATFGWTASTNGSRRRGPASVVRDLEQVDARQALAEQGRVDPVLDVAHQQEPASTDLPEQDDRHVVDPGPAVGRRGRDRPVGRPQHAQRDVVDGEPVAGPEAPSRRRRRTVEPSRPRRVPRARVRASPARRPS